MRAHPRSAHRLRRNGQSMISVCEKRHRITVSSHVRGPDQEDLHKSFRSSEIYPSDRSGAPKVTVRSTSSTVRRLSSSPTPVGHDGRVAGTTPPGGRPTTLPPRGRMSAQCRFGQTTDGVIDQMDVLPPGRQSQVSESGTSHPPTAQCLLRRVQMQADDITDLVDELRVVRRLERVGLMRLETNAHQIRPPATCSARSRQPSMPATRCVAPAGARSNVATTTRSICSSMILCGAPGRVSSTRPRSRRSTNRSDADTFSATGSRRLTVRELRQPCDGRAADPPPARKSHRRWRRARIESAPSPEWGRRG
jgi:hypothetical protein